jgi:multisubunit Na+/H+ antiporter MnhB subunit
MATSTYIVGVAIAAVAIAYFYMWRRGKLSRARSVGISLIAIGAIIAAFGIIFFLQGNSIVGPHSSFMYSNPKWVVNGGVIAAVGAGIIVSGIVISLRHPRSLGKS